MDLITKPIAIILRIPSSVYTTKNAKSILSLLFVIKSTSLMRAIITLLVPITNNEKVLNQGLLTKWMILFLKGLVSESPHSETGE